MFSGDNFYLETKNGLVKTDNPLITYLMKQWLVEKFGEGYKGDYRLVGQGLDSTFFDPSLLVRGAITNMAKNFTTDFLAYEDQIIKSTLSNIGDKIGLDMGLAYFIGPKEYIIFKGYETYSAISTFVGGNIMYNYFNYEKLINRTFEFIDGAFAPSIPQTPYGSLGTFLYKIASDAYEGLTSKNKN